MVGGCGAESRSPAGWCTSTPRDDTWWRSAEWTSGMRTAKQYYLRKAKCEMTTIAIMNLKGGVGKTVTAINLADVLAAAGKRTLLVDCDGLTGSCEPCWDDNIQEISDKVWLLPGSSGLYRMDVAAVRGGSAGWQKAMRDYRDAVAEDGEVDYLVFDCPPGFTCASIAALMAADDVVIPMLVDGFSLWGVTDLAAQINGIKSANPRVRVSGVLITQWHRCDAVQQGEALLRSLGLPVFRTVIRRTDKIPESTFDRAPIRDYSPRSAASLDYQAWVEEYLHEEVQHGEV